MPHKTSKPDMALDKQKAEMFQIFQNVQFNVVQHKKYAKELTKLYRKMDQEEFKENFQRALHYLFTFGDSSPAVDRVVQFVASFCTTLDDEEEFLLFIFEIIFSCQCVAGQSVRFRASQLLAAVLAALGDDASLDDDLCDKLLISQKERLQDTRGAVRCRAALALQRLQNPTEPDDPVTTAYRFHMCCDPSSSVRRAIVTCIAKCTRNVPFVLERLCDVDEAVRRAAFIYVAAINVTQLKVRQRVHILKVGLTERNPRVRRVVEEILLPGWLSTFKGNIVELLTAVRLDNATGARDSQYVAGKLLESLFKRQPISELLEWLPTDKTLRVIPADKLCKETACYWRHLTEHLVKIDDEDTLEMVLPDLVVLVGYIKAIVESPCPDQKQDPVGFGIRQYVIHELVSMLGAYDACDQVGRDALSKLIMDTLTGDYGPMSEETIQALVSSLCIVIRDVSQRIELVVSVVSQLREPPEVEPPTPQPPQETNEVKLQRARLRVSLNVAMEAQQEAALEQNYALASECKKKVERIQRQLEELGAQQPPPPVEEKPREKSSDPAVLNRCLQIINFALDSPHITTITPLLRVLFTELEEEIFQNAALLENSLKTVALYGMLDAEFAKEHKAFFFANLLDLTNEPISCTVLQCICDLLCVHGLRLFEDDQLTKEEDDDDGERDMSLLLTPSHGTVVEVLLKAMDSQCSSYRLIVVEGLCRLMTLGHLESPSILSRLLLLWFSPTTEEEDLLRQTIGMFFQTFAVSVDGAQEQIQKAVIPTLKALANAPNHSPLAEIDQDAIIRFMMSLTRIQQEMWDSQGSMALLLVNHLVDDHSRAAALVCRCLALLQPPRDPQLASDLASNLTNLPELPDKTSARHIARYLGALESVEKSTKISTMGTMATINEDGAEETNETTSHGRATCSLPSRPPLARSTHINQVVINETAEEEIEINESSPEEQATQATQASKKADKQKTSLDDSRVSILRGSKVPNDSPLIDIDKQGKQAKKQVNKQAETDKQADKQDDRRVTLVRGSKLPEFDSPLISLSPDVDDIPGTQENGSDSEDASPRKRSKKDGKLPREGGSTKSENSSDDTEKGVKRTRSQTDSLTSTPVKTKKKPKKAQMETTKPQTTPETPLRRSSRSLQSNSSSDSIGSQKSKSDKSEKSSGKSEKSSGKSEKSSGKSEKSSGKSVKAASGKAGAPSVKGKGAKGGKGKKEESLRRSSVRSPVRSDSSGDETELHTIVYETEMAQSILADSSDEDCDKSTGNVTIPETPESSDRSAQSSPDMLQAPTRKVGKKK